MSPCWRIAACVLLAASNSRAQATVRVSVSSAGAEAHGRSFSPALSADGRYVAFVGEADDLVAGDSNGSKDVFVRDRFAGTTVRVSVATGGAQASGDSDSPAISADGRYVAFRSFAPDLVSGDANGCPDIFLRDQLAGTTVRVSVDSAGLEADGPSELPSLSADGSRLAFSSSATNLVPGDTNFRADAFVRDLLAGTTAHMSVSSSGTPGNSGSGEALISA